MARLTTLMLIMLVTVGCQSPRWRQRDSRAPAGGFASPRMPAPVAPGFAPGPVPANHQPGFATPGPATPFPTAPPSLGSTPAPTPAGPTSPFPTVPPGPSTDNPGPGISSKYESHWQPAEARTPAKNPPRVLLAPPEPVTDEPAPKKPNTSSPQEEGASPMLPSTSLPVGIPRFAHVKKGVATGLKPTLDDGFAWLKANQYRTVVHLRLPGAPDDADRSAAEKRGLRYATLEVSPNALTKDNVDEFFKIVRDAQQHPVLVYDEDGTLAGGLWYLWFRLGEDAPDEVARIRARTLGLREDGEGAHREMWQAVQKYVNDGKAR